MLVYLSPQYNSLPEYFGNGWGNNRFSRTFDVPSSILSSVDHRQYAWTFDLSTQKTDGNIEYAQSFYKAKDVPEYLIRRPFRYLKYFDERIPGWLDHFGFPSFYRYSQKRFLRDHCTDEDIYKAVNYWEKDDDSLEIRQLSFCLDYYLKRNDLNGSAVDRIFILKSHMIALRLLRFSDMADLLKNRIDFPVLLEKFNINKLIGEGDELMVPGNFIPGSALAKFSKASFIAQSLNILPDNVKANSFLKMAEELNENKPDEFINGLLELSKKLNISSLSVIFRQCKSNFESIRKGEFLERMAYPDSQAFENLRYVFITVNDNELFERVVKKMNEIKKPFPDAVKKLICRKLEIEENNFQLFIKAVKEYTNFIKYYCQGGLIQRLRTKGNIIPENYIVSLENELEKEMNELIVQNIKVVIDDVINKKI